MVSYIDVVRQTLSRLPSVETKNIHGSAVVFDNRDLRFENNKEFPMASVVFSIITNYNPTVLHVVCPPELQSDWLEAFGDFVLIQFIEREFPYTKDGFSKLMLDPTFWENFAGDNVLVFQRDSALLKEIPENKYKRTLYIGAPYAKFRDEHCHIPFMMNNAYGWKDMHDLPLNGMNGGLSIRNIGWTKTMLEQFPPEKIPMLPPEDVYFSHLLSLRGKAYEYEGHIPTFWEAAEFSVESLPYPKPYGVHVPNIHNQLTFQNFNLI